MTARKFFRALGYGLLGFLVLIILFLAIAIAPVDRTPITNSAGYQQTMKMVREATSIDIPKPIKKFSVGFSKINLTPAEPTSTAGYGNRKGKKYTKVADSIFVRALVIQNGAERAAIVSADLLLIPPGVTSQLLRKLPAIGFSLENTFLGATHTHNSIGNWSEGAASFLYGKYDPAIVDLISDKIIESIQKASEDCVEAHIKTGRINAADAVKNRLTVDGPTDPNLRIVQIERSDSSELVLASFTAHATCLYSKDLELSRDYPGKLVDKLESTGYDFAMFMAGAVASHKPAAPEFGKDCIDWMADHLTHAILEGQHDLREVSDTTLLSYQMPINTGDPQLKISNDWKVRSWLFRAALGEYPMRISILRIGDLVMFGVPADFSGEFDPYLDSVATQQNLHMMVTSFNGGYMGYLTPEKYYDNPYFETQFMNWYAPGAGEYVRDVLAELLLKMNAR